MFCSVNIRVKGNFHFALFSNAKRLISHQCIMWGRECKLKGSYYSIPTTSFTQARGIIRRFICYGSCQDFSIPKLGYRSNENLQYLSPCSYYHCIKVSELKQRRACPEAIT